MFRSAYKEVTNMLVRIKRGGLSKYRTVAVPHAVVYLCLPDYLI